MSDTKTAATRTGKASEAFSDDERAAMQEHVREQKAASKRSSASARADGERDVQARIAEMPDADRALAERIHAIVTETAPDLVPRTWYGMPAYSKDGKVICFFKAAAKFKSRYATFGFEEAATIDEGTMWPTSYGLTELTPADEARIAELVQQAVR